MATSHVDLKMTEGDFLSSNNDVMEALEENGVGEKEINEVIAILDSMKGDVVKA